MTKMSFANEAIAQIENAEFDNVTFDMIAARNVADSENVAFRSTALTIVTQAQQQLNSVDAITSYSAQLIAAVDARSVYESAKNAANDSMQKTLRKIKTSVSHARIAEIMMTCNVDANMLNREERVNARYNVKSYDKIVNIARVLAKVEVLNIYTRAILASAQQFENNEMIITQRETKLACSAHNRIADVKRNSCLIRTHKIFDMSTCSTQASSTNNALQTYNILIETRDSANNVCFKLNRENAATQALLELL